MTEPGTDRSGQGRALPAHFREKSPLTDTAGVPWAGRDYAPVSYTHLTLPTKA